MAFFKHTDVGSKAVFGDPGYMDHPMVMEVCIRTYIHTCISIFLPISISIYLFIHPCIQSEQKYSDIIID